MAGPVAAVPRPQPPAPLGNRPFLRLAIALAFVAGASAAGLYAFVWWEERPLAEVERLLDAGEPRKALISVNRFLREHPQHGRGLALKARTLSASGQVDAAIDLYERVGAADPKDLHALAQALLHRQQWSAALPILKVLETTDLHKADVLHELAGCKSRLGDFDGALESAEKFSKQPGMEARGQLLLGTIHRDRGNLQQAATAWGDVLRLRPDAADLQIGPAEFFLEYGRVLYGIGEMTLAAEQFQRSLELEEAAPTLVALGNAQVQLGQVESANENLQRALELEPGALPPRVGLAQLALTQRNAEQAFEFLSPLQSSGEMTGEIAYLFQRIYTLRGDTAQATHWRDRADELRKSESIRNTTDQILRDSPESNWAHVIRAHRFAEEGNWDEAERILKPLAPTAPDQPFIQALDAAVKSRGTLPPLSDLPMVRF
ncbi:MAG: tetratricopeptide repeat protein [Planctomyces sp.]|nr:tetratricopeptide repeat protein [Planctomyces sp.]